MPNAISERALFARVARKIAHDGLSLHRCRYDARSFRDTGRYFTCNAPGHVDACFVQLEQWGRELGVMHENEQVANE